MRRDISHLLKKNLLILFILALIAPVFCIFAETDPAEERKALEAELKQLEEQIAKYDQDLTKTQQEKDTLNNQITTLKQKINKLNLQIQQSNVMIKDIGIQISDTENSIENTSLKIEDSKSKLADIIQTIYEEDQKSVIEILLSGKTLSNFFDNLVALETLNLKKQELLQEIKGLKSDLEGQKDSLDNEKTDLERMVAIQTLQKQENEANRKNQEYYLKLTEAQYQQSLKEKQEVEKMAAGIRARIFELIGVSKAPTFGEAYELAKDIEKLTGVRPAFLLAILTQESNLGKNVGQCYLKDTKTGSGVTSKGKEIANVMKPTRDVSPFLTITQELGRDPYDTPVSCPMSFGYGGAMGPAQFIPSTWMLYRDRIKTITGKPGDPWNMKDAFLAAALYLSDCGAKSQTWNSEWRSAMIYFSGSTNTKYRFYGDSVMAIVARYESDIAELESGN
ncbi:MAG: lytic murein transglycosylase [Patescibacteria group bacterium]